MKHKRKISYFLKGWGSINLRWPKIKSNEEAWKEDAEKIAGDWKKVGDDMREAIQQFKSEKNERRSWK